MIENILKNRQGEDDSIFKKFVDREPGNVRTTPAKIVATISETKCRRHKKQEKGLGDAMKTRGRTTFSQFQLHNLEWRFERNKYLTTGDRLRLANELKLNQLQVKTWFQVRVPITEAISVLWILLVRVEY